MLLDVPGNELRHLKHGDLCLAVENQLEGCIRVDERLFDRILKLVFLDVVPKLLGHFTAGQRRRTDDGRKDRVGLDWLHERRVGFARGGFFGFAHWHPLPAKRLLGETKKSGAPRAASWDSLYSMFLMGGGQSSRENFQ